MAKSVHDELVNVLVEHGGFEKMAAMMELNKWAQEKRYLRDLVSIFVVIHKLLLFIFC